MGSVYLYSAPPVNNQDEKTHVQNLKGPCVIMKRHLQRNFSFIIVARQSFFYFAPVVSDRRDGPPGKKIVRQKNVESFSHESEVKKK